MARTVRDKEKEKFKSGKKQVAQFDLPNHSARVAYAAAVKRGTPDAEARLVGYRTGVKQENRDPKIEKLLIKNATQTPTDRAYAGHKDRNLRIAHEKRRA
tara:strand:+ start:28 stop:327 length:300 start_codon:yes stop_codon:yes gene_type:complete